MAASAADQREGLRVGDECWLVGPVLLFDQLLVGLAHVQKRKRLSNKIAGLRSVWLFGMGLGRQGCYAIVH